MVSREHLADGTRAFVVISKNANVATGAAGPGRCATRSSAASPRPRLRRRRRAHRVDRRHRPALPDGQRARPSRRASPRRSPVAEAEPAARGIMTTDTVPKVAAATSAGAATVVGIAKGVGMIEPDMATLIALFFTDAAIGSRGARRDVPSGDRPHLQRGEHRHRHVDQRHGGRSWRAATPGRSTSPTSRPRSTTSPLSLTKQIARDGEGADEADRGRRSTGARRRRPGASGSPRRSSTRRS